MNRILSIALVVIAAGIILFAPRVMSNLWKCSAERCDVFGLFFEEPTDPTTIPPPPDEPEASWQTPELYDAIKTFKASPSEQTLKALMDLIPRSEGDRSEGHEEIEYYLETDLPTDLTGVCAWVERLSGVPPYKFKPCADVQRPEDVQRQKTAQPESTTGFRPELRTYSCRNRQSNKVVDCIWDRGQREHLSYTFDDESFRRARVPVHRYLTFQQEFRNAVTDWNNACKDSHLPDDEKICGLIIHHPEENYQGGSDLTKFIVRFENQCVHYPNGKSACLNTNVWARGFVKTMRLPHKLLVGSKLMNARDPAYQWARTLRHEIGHILGYGHEQYAASKLVICSSELRNFSPGGGVEGVDTGAAYDKESIMLSSGCINGNVLPAKLSDHDRRRHVQIYGADEGER